MLVTVHARVNYDMCIIGVSPSVQTVTASRCCGFAAVGPAVRSYYKRTEH